MSSKKIKINPDKFALAVVSGSTLTESDDVKASKVALQRYLSAYLLIEDYNNLEDKNSSIFNSQSVAEMMENMSKALQSKY
ncbi:MAG: hypothetical protein LKJ60_06195 [Lentilactobacillus buchneri]|jgi:hypothetical protein|nr:hypothetical protein [Lentilactobacillus buchneri]